MKVYTFGAKTREYIGEETAFELPAGGRLIPFNATETPPPVAGEHETPVWDGAAWTLAEDWRGTHGWLNGAPHEIKELGPRPEGWTETPPPRDIEDVRADALEMLGYVRRSVIENGHVQYNGHEFGTSAEDRVSLLLALETGAAEFDGVPVDGMDGLHALARDIAAFADGQNAIARSLENQIKYAKTIEDIEAVHWPEE